MNKIRALSSGTVGADGEDEPKNDRHALAARFQACAEKNRAFNSRERPLKDQRQRSRMYVQVR